MTTLTQPFLNAASFLKRQQKDWLITVARMSLDKLGYQIVFPYLSIYIIALGATATQLGLMNSIGMVIAGIIAPFSGWLIDKNGPKKLYLFGIGLVAISYLTYGIAHNWGIAIIAMSAYWIGFSVSIHSCATVCGNCLKNEDRATGMMICETVAAGLLGMVGPMAGAWLVTSFGGPNAAGIRYVFFFSLAIIAVSFTVVLTQLSNARWRPANTTKPNIFKDLNQVFKEGKHLKKWLFIATVGQLPIAMVFPFSQLYAYEVKGAASFILGAMVTCSALTSIVFAIPLGRLADRIGRKKILFATIPLFWVSNILLVWSPNAVFLIAAGIFQGFHYIGGPISNAMERELVTPAQMGRWLGLARLSRMPLSAIMALVCGIVWDKVGPQWVFLAFIVIDLLVRIPLLIAMPETLSMRVARQNST